MVTPHGCLSKDGRVATFERDLKPRDGWIADFIRVADGDPEGAHTLAIREWDALMQSVDVIVAPTNGPQLTATNLTGHPALILPSGFRETDGTPVSLTFLGRLFGEESLLRVAHAFQRATPHHLKHPALG